MISTTITKIKNTKPYRRIVLIEYFFEMRCGFSELYKGGSWWVSKY